MQHTISVLVENNPGVLSKVSGLFTRRGFNIESLAVGETEDKSISRMTIIVDGDDYLVEQIEKQLNKLISTIKVKTLKENTYISKMLMMVKVCAPLSKRTEIIQIAEMMGAKINDVSKECIILELCDTPEKCDNFESLMQPFGIRELVRTGSIAIEKGDTQTKQPVNQK